MPINLNKLDISLDQFNMAAKGQYNIGQLKLGEDGASVVRINNHKFFTSLNHKPIRPEESLALKNAFCNAFRKEGLSEEAVAEIRKKLGLGDTILDTLSAGNIKPLSAGEVREIIDQYAKQLNQSRAPDARIKTSDDFYRGVSKETLDDRKIVRDARNAVSVAEMETKVGGVVNQLVDLLLTEESASNFSISSKAIALEILKDLRPSSALSKPDSAIPLTVAPITLKRDRDGMVIARFQMGDGSIFSVGTKMNKQQLVSHLENILQAPEGDTESEETQEEPQAPEAPKGAQVSAPAQPKAPRKKALDPEQMQLIDKIKTTFATVRNPEKMAMNKEAILLLLPKKHKRIEYTQEVLESHARSQLRTQLTDSILDKLVPMLRKARGMDPRNTELSHQVRAFISGDESIDPDELIGKITDALTTEPVDFKAQIVQGGDPAEDDFDKPLNINAILGNNE